jgi:hypothetical protein
VQATELACAALRTQATRGKTVTEILRFAKNTEIRLSQPHKSDRNVEEQPYKSTTLFFFYSNNYNRRPKTSSQPRNHKNNVTSGNEN